MALDQSALLELLAQLKLTDVTDRIRSATETLYQELIDAEATAPATAAGPIVRKHRGSPLSEISRVPVIGRHRPVNSPMKRGGNQGVFASNFKEELGGKSVPPAQVRKSRPIEPR
jgi:hypothetical protein